jgi:hypothetical protein
MYGRNRLRRLLPAFALAALVAGLAAPAQARQAARHAAVGAGLGSEVRALLSRLWDGGSRGLHTLFGAEGASLDPHGGAPAAGSGAGSGAAATQGHGGV